MKRCHWKVGGNLEATHFFQAVWTALGVDTLPAPRWRPCRVRDLLCGEDLQAVSSSHTRLCRRTESSSQELPPTRRPLEPLPSDKGEWSPSQRPAALHVGWTKSRRRGLPLWHGADLAEALAPNTRPPPTTVQGFCFLRVQPSLLVAARCPVGNTRDPRILWKPLNFLLSSFGLREAPKRALNSLP